MNAFYFLRSVGPILYHQAKGTFEDSMVHTFNSAIWEHEHNDLHCIVGTEENGGTLWNGNMSPDGGMTWTVIDTGVQYFILAPDRVAYEKGRSLMVYDFQNNPTSIGTGRLIGVSNKRVLYLNNGRKWDDGHSANGIAWLLKDDTIQTYDDFKKERYGRTEYKSYGKY
jgi:hypothetical protein